MTPQVSGHWDRIPEELRWNQQWCIAGPDKAPYMVGNKGPYRVKTVERTTWYDFETACEMAVLYNTHIGYILTKEDAYSCIDLDVCDAESQAQKGEPHDPSKWTTQEQFNRYWSIVQHFDSYTEKSRSGKGLHIWVRGNIGAGRKRDGVEVYSQERFIICTGDIVVNKPVIEKQELLNILVKEMTVNQEVLTELVELEPVEADSVIWGRAANASNNSKFIPLCEGRWQDLGYPSQSEADFSLISMLTFYTKSNEQVRRMFRQTVLGSRAKTNKNNYHIDKALRSIRAREEREAEGAEHGKQLAERLMMGMRKTDSVAGLVQKMQQKAHQESLIAATVPQPAPAVVSMAQLAPLPVVHNDGLPWPPGLTGAIAGFIYQSAPRPAKEVAIVAALGLMAGICGKSFGIPQSGLNLYIILVARSAIGKEAMHSGISFLLEALRNRHPQCMSYVDFNDFASGPALSKAVAANPSFVNIAGEWGRKIKRLANESMHDGPMQSLRTVMTNLYQKSGPSAIVGGISYSNKDQNISSVSGVSYSMIGETTPSTLYESLTTSMMEDGFLSRFTIIEYTGQRPAENENQKLRPDEPLIESLMQLCIHSTTLISRNARQEVGRDETAGRFLKAFGLECDVKINDTDDESFRQMYNRAQLKATRIAALLAVADNYIHPVIQIHHAEWAVDVVRRDIAVMNRRINDGDVGLNDMSRERKVMSVCAEYLKVGAAKGYEIPADVQHAGIIPRKFLQARIARVMAFNSHKLGSTAALDATLRSLVDSGYLLEVDKSSMIKDYKYHGKCYRILHLMNEPNKK